MKAYYQEIAPDYARYRGVHPEVLRSLITTGQLNADSHVIEVGCGTGNYAAALAKAAGCKCWGIDPSEEMLAKAASHSPQIQVRCGHAESLTFPDEFFDLMFSVDVVHHLTDRRKAFREAIRVLRPGGRLCIATDSADILRARQPLSRYFPETVEVELARYLLLGSTKPMPGKP